MKKVFLFICCFAISVMSLSAANIEITFDGYAEGELLEQVQGDLTWTDGRESHPALSYLIEDGQLVIVQQEDRGQWIYINFENQTGPITVTWDWQFVGNEDQAEGIDVGFCLSDFDNFALGDNPETTWNEQGGMARMGVGGVLDARFGDLEGGGDYFKDADVVYSDGALIHMRMEIDGSSDEYSVYAQRDGEDEIQIADAFFLRRAFVDGIDTLSI
ncbi:hypothetical protein GF373_04405, partial [bacterium]|nr:hypothetical protein [bacterium]